MSRRWQDQQPSSEDPHARQSSPSTLPPVYPDTAPPYILTSVSNPSDASLDHLRVSHQFGNLRSISPSIENQCPDYHTGEARHFFQAHDASAHRPGHFYETNTNSSTEQWEQQSYTEFPGTSELIPSKSSSSPETSVFWENRRSMIYSQNHVERGNFSSLADAVHDSNPPSQARPPPLSQSSDFPMVTYDLDQDRTPRAVHQHLGDLPVATTTSIPETQEPYPVPAHVSPLVPEIVATHNYKIAAGSTEVHHGHHVYNNASSGVEIQPTTDSVPTASPRYSDIPMDTSGNGHGFLHHATHHAPPPTDRYYEMEVDIPSTTGNQGMLSSSSANSQLLSLETPVSQFSLPPSQTMGSAQNNAQPGLYGQGQAFRHASLPRDGRGSRDSGYNGMTSSASPVWTRVSSTNDAGNGPIPLSFLSLRYAQLSTACHKANLEKDAHIRAGETPFIMPTLEEYLSTVRSPTVHDALPQEWKDNPGIRARPLTRAQLTLINQCQTVDLLRDESADPETKTALAQSILARPVGEAALQVAMEILRGSSATEQSFND